MEALQVFNYNNEGVSFKNEDGTAYVNATEMAKPFGKRPVDYLRLPSSIELINAIVRKSHNCENQIVITKQGSVESGGGTWMMEDVALDFAQWLSVDFKLWCNDRIKELMKYGMTATTDMVEQMMNNPDLLIRTLQDLKSERQQKEILEEQYRLQEKELKSSAPKVKYFENVMQSTSTYVADQIAKELGTTAVTMNKTLVERGVLIRRNNQLLLTAPYADKNYTKTKTYYYTKTDGSMGTNTQTVWTERGRVFLHAFLGN